MTEWRTVSGWDGFYEVSSEGGVRSLSRTTLRRDGTQQTWAGRLCGQPVSSTGYHVVRLSDAAGERRVMARVHRLVASAFIPNPANLPEVNHRDGIKTHNSVSNLEWVTPHGSRKHAWDMGLRTREHLPVKYGEESNSAVLKVAEVVEIRAQHARGVSIHALARQFGVSRRTLQAVVRGQSWIAALPAPPAGETE